MTFKNLFFCCFTLFVTLFSIVSKAQDIDTTPNEENNKISHRFSGNLGLSYSSFQDIKFSKVQYSGLGFVLDLDYLNTKRKGFWGFSFKSLINFETPSTFDEISITVVNAILSGKYLRPLILKDYQLYLGLEVDFSDTYFRFVPEVGNNTIFPLYSNGYKISSLYKRKINSNIQLEAMLNIQVFGFIKELQSFTFSVPQIMLTEGKFDYQENVFNFTPLAYDKYYEFASFLNYFNISTEIRINYKKTWGIVYRWNYQRSNRIPNYPVNRGYNSLSLLYNFIHK